MEHTDVSVHTITGDPGTRMEVTFTGIKNGKEFTFTGRTEKLIVDVSTAHEQYDINWCKMWSPDRITRVQGTFKLVENRHGHWGTFKEKVICRRSK